ncbi:hypothetical protein ANI02nite_24280 [Acetobacter nitrogenifigens DSM 23921 = NBRC 105050]|uniref:Uncharacterized protein n=1 Tax=Acetobacter nitrogenifigens DSM 23921 = NBRC 105050 TaxID=1120919 RepID=A0A511XC49_9PROT|nr:hypothetical protein ANI02nite_24280 [Acetobacter nitrogenifigens DSM 23921 = NBRC 105050]
MKCPATNSAFNFALNAEGGLSVPYPFPMADVLRLPTGAHKAVVTASDSAAISNHVAPDVRTLSKKICLPKSERLRDGKSRPSVVAFRDNRRRVVAMIVLQRYIEIERRMIL